MNKLHIFLGAALLAGAIYGSWVVIHTITHVDVSRWPTYRNDEYGFSFQYNPSNTLLSKPFKASTGPGGTSYWEIDLSNQMTQIVSMSDRFSATVWYDTPFGSDPSVTGFTAMDSAPEPITLNGVDGYSYHGRDSLTDRIVYVFPTKNKKTLEFVYEATGDPNYQLIKPVLKQILASIRIDK